MTRSLCLGELLREKILFRYLIWILSQPKYQIQPFIWFIFFTEYSRFTIYTKPHNHIFTRDSCVYLSSRCLFMSVGENQVIYEFNFVHWWWTLYKQMVISSGYTYVYLFSSVYSNRFLNLGNHWVAQL
jgi:hypothetical protein